MTMKQSDTRLKAYQKDDFRCAVERHAARIADAERILSIALDDMRERLAVARRVVANAEWTIENDVDAALLMTDALLDTPTGFDLAIEAIKS